MYSKWVAFLCLAVGLSSVHAATVLTTSTDEPTDAIVSNPSGTSYTRSFHDGNSGKTTRGNSFLLPDTGDEYPGFQVTGVTLRKNTLQSFGSGDALQLWLFAWDPDTDGNDESNWTQSGTTGTDDGDPTSGTGMTSLLATSVDLNGLSFADESYLTFDFSASPLYLSENKVFGFLIGYADGAGDSSYFEYAEAGSSYPDGIEIRTAGIPSVNSVYAPRDVVFYINGGAIDASIYATDDDEDGLSDVWEVMNFGNQDPVGTGNPDGDGLDNEAEQANGTDPNLADSDADGLNDDVEVAAGTDPLDDDTDDDGLLDSVETGTGTYVGPSDTGTNPRLADSDADGVDDATEIQLGFDPSDVSHFPNLTEKPNIVFIMIDDLDIREIGVYGQATLQTPRVDAMASEGLMFTDFYTASPVCQSCRSCLMSGQDARRAQDRHNSTMALQTDRVTLAELLQQAGYTTGLVGKWGLGGSTSVGAPWKQGFDFFCGYLSQTAAHDFFPKYLWKNDQKIYFNEDQLGEGDRLYIEGAQNFDEHTHYWTDNFGNVCSHDVVVAEGLQFIEDNADKPFFLYCAWTPPHAYMYPAATLDALTDDDGLLYDPLDLDQTLINEVYPGMPFGEDETSAGWPDFNDHCYASMVSAADRDTGRIMDKLVELGIENNTLVIFCSDNGEDEPTFLTAEHLKPGYSDFNGMKRDCYEGGIREPFVAWWPGTIQTGTATGVVGTFADMLPTFAEMAGISTPSQITGRSILPVLLGGTEVDLQPCDYHYWDFTEGTRRWRAVRRGDWKIVRDRATDGSAPTYELFNLAADLYETTDLSATETEILARLIPLVEGTHEVPVSTYFKADDEFFTKNSLTVAAHLFGAYDAAGANNGFELTPSGTGSGFNYLPFETGLVHAAQFDWKFNFPSSSAASFLLGEANDASQCLAVRIDAGSSQVVISCPGQTSLMTTLPAADFAGSTAECMLELDPVTGAGQLVVGSTILPFDFATDLGALQFWGYEVESAAVYASRPRWRMMPSTGGVQQLVDGKGILAADYTVPSAHGDEEVVLQYSTDLQGWTANPPGVIDLRSTGSQGELQGSWTLPADSLLPRNNDALFIRVQGAE
ncbi:sulfatase-like hydrolase/transferase [Pontiella sp.]|uniref:sulfatase-like hydrolase/transferase n=1 Tax=Pontiella sp. TaxID=2837462 RepID=UPI00356478D2